MLLELRADHERDANTNSQSVPRGLPHRGTDPEFGDCPSVGPPLRPRDLYRTLFLDPEEHAHYVEPAYRLVRSLLDGVAVPSVRLLDVDAAATELVAWARDTVHPLDLEYSAPSWTARVVRELSPVGLADGAWLRGASRAAMLGDNLGVCLLDQLALRFGNPAGAEGHAYRYAALLRSIGVPPGSIARWTWDESAQCIDISYELGLFALCLGLFPSTLLLETLGFNLWMASVGPAPLLEKVAIALRQNRANLRYVDLYDRAKLTHLARHAIHLAAATDSTVDLALARVARGFAAAHTAYQRWEAAMRGSNIAFSPADSVLEMVGRKARFAAAHHGKVRLGGRCMQQLFEEGGASHEWLLECLAKSHLIRPGDPDGSRFLGHTLSIDGPMFDAFTAHEKMDLRAWIQQLGEGVGSKSTSAPVPLAGHYSAGQDLSALETFAERRYGSLPDAELLDCMYHADRHPALALFARRHASKLLQAWEAALSQDERLASRAPPPYSEAGVEALARSAAAGTNATEDRPASGASGALDSTMAVCLAGPWLSGFSDVRRSTFDDFGWGFLLYRSAYGATETDREAHEAARARSVEAWRHVLFPDAGVVPAALDGRRLLIAALGLGLNTHLFMPELIGMELALGHLRGAPHISLGSTGERPNASAHRCARCNGSKCDNAQPRWATWAAYAFMKRVRDAAPSSVERQWQRLWRGWRAANVVARGTDAERAALNEALLSRDPSSLQSEHRP